MIALLGEGGMGKVWRAHHTALKRDDALKVLPDAVATDPDRLARFQREAQVLASLNHSNIAHVHGLEDVGGVKALVMELVEGPTLDERIAQGSIPIDEALPIARQIADGLEAAHEQGIVHRDLKPANIKVRPDGTVKVLDFGLAKAMDSGASGTGEMRALSPTITSPAMMTGVGMILGTAAYMSPEQARGKVVDRRADIWAFGCVLYEMLTGTRAFEDEDVSLTLSKVLRLEPDFSALPADVPPRVRQALRVCLQKDLRQRAQAIGDVRLALDGAFESAGAQAVPRATVAPPVWRRAAPATAAVVITSLIVGLGMWTLTRPAPPPLVHLTIAHPGPEVVGGNDLDANVAVSPDGRHVAYVAGASSGSSNALRLYVRALDSRQPKLLSTSARSPFFSPDGQWIGFVEGNGWLSKVALTGGPSVRIGGVANAPRGASWGSDDTIVFATIRSAGLLRIAAAGGEVEELTKPAAERGEGDHQFPEVLPGARAVLFTIANQDIDKSQIAVLDLATRAYRVLIQGGSHARYVESGHIVYAVAGSLRAVAFDLGRLEVRGTPVPVLDDVVTKVSGAASFSVAPAGTLVYVRGSATEGRQRTLVWVDRMGREEPLGMEPRNYIDVALSPDGTRAAVTVLADDQVEADVWVWSLVRRTLTRLTFEPGRQGFPLWSQDGTRIVYESRGKGLFWQPADGTGTAERLLENADDTAVVVPDSWSADGRLVFTKRVQTRWDIGVLQLDGNRTAAPLLASPTFNEQWGVVSPDGRWVAYQSNESGSYEIYVRPFPNVETGKWQVSSGGGTIPRWSADGRTLFFHGADSVMASTIQTVPTFAPATPERVLSREGLVGGYNVSPDGKRFLMLKNVEAAGAAAPPELDVILNWSEELKRLVPAN